MTTYDIRFRSTPPESDAVYVDGRIIATANLAVDPVEVETVPLVLDVDPANPAEQILETHLAPFPEGWAGVVFIHADGSESTQSALVRFPAPGDLPDWVPTPDDVALLLRTRTVGDVSGGLGGDTQATGVTIFTASTRPTASEVQGLINAAHRAVLDQITAPISLGQQGAAGHAIALYAAVLVESSFFGEQAATSNLQTLFDNQLKSLTHVALNAGPWMA